MHDPIVQGSDFIFVQIRDRRVVDVSGIQRAFSQCPVNNIHVDIVLLRILSRKLSIRVSFASPGLEYYLSTLSRFCQRMRCKMIQARRNHAWMIYHRPEGIIK